MRTLNAAGFPADSIRRRARLGAPAIFPSADEYGQSMFGARRVEEAGDVLDEARLVPPVFMPQRLEKLIDLAREPLYTDVDLTTDVGGMRSAFPAYVSAFGSTRAGTDLGAAAARQAGRLGMPLVIGENVVPVGGYRSDEGTSLLHRLRAYQADLPDGLGGLAVQQSTEDADAEVWNLVYSDPAGRDLLATGRLAFELKVGQGAKPGLGGMTLVDAATATRLNGQYALDPMGGSAVLRSSSPGTYTEEILRQQIRLTRNNFPRARVWVKLPPARDVADACAVAWAAGADAVTVDGAEGGSGWAPDAFLRTVGLPLGECLTRIGSRPAGCLMASGRMWEGTRAIKALALGARAAGLGRAALLAVDEDPEHGLERLVECLAMEMRMLISALGQYSPANLGPDDVWGAAVTRNREPESAGLA